ncbi:hypothetical protein BB559_002984 [Furculomyces boomerangus]|uniref:Uncharacterized protein n=2 Tax=Harpellales TaxID=61421 RepID=A0A2T9YQ66_9FUNG|nr:hypothetical protein BB559_002984 [Furculomyces boomerangus]PVZ97883.1 hypothetical protein BB558_006147 [Smittium angustum]
MEILQLFRNLDERSRIKLLKEIVAETTPYEKLHLKKALSMNSDGRFDMFSCLNEDVVYSILSLFNLKQIVLLLSASISISSNTNS